MTRLIRPFLLVLFAAALAAPVSLLAQQADAPPDSPEITAMIAQIRKDAGPVWESAVHFWCEAPYANRADDPPITPTRILDDVYAIGNVGTTVYVVKTSAGLLMIDALGGGTADATTAQLDSQLLPGFRALGLDPAQVKIILVTHGHPDHWGGAAYFQQHFGSKVYVSAVDWETMENPGRGRRGAAPGARSAAPAGPRPARTAAPAHDADIVDGVPIVLGDLRVTPVAIPGHTPGSMAFIFPVHDRGTAHMAAIFGGASLTPRTLTDEGFQTYLASVMKFKEATTRAKVDVVLQNHPLMVPIQTRLDALAHRGPRDPNPFVVGADSYQRFVDVMAGCSRVNIARRKH
jgi:metallo-beta-lactamase class B